MTQPVQHAGRPIAVDIDARRLTPHGDEAPRVRIADMTFVIRATGERTAAAAAHVLRKQVDRAMRAESDGKPGGRGARADQVRVVTERPFVNAVRRTMEIGLEAGLRPGRDPKQAWTVGMDADVLLVDEGVERLRVMCQTAAPRSFTVTALMLCKFYGGFVFRGIHCYRRSLLDMALPLVGVGGTDGGLKPESAVVHAMADRGHKYEGHPIVLAAHDFEQSYKHIYLKTRMRARREEDADGLIRWVKGRADADADYLVALWGIEDGLKDSPMVAPSSPQSGGGAADGPSNYDWEAEYPELRARMDRAGLKDKAPMPPEAGIGYAERAIAAHDRAHDVRTPEWIQKVLWGGPSTVKDERPAEAA